MNNTKSTKRALLSSVMAMLICVAMLIGTTFAWFTDSAVNTGNRIQAGNLDIDLLMDKDGKGVGDYESIADGTGDIFNELTNGAKWEPGRTEIVYLAIKNNGDLAASVDFYIHAKKPENVEDLSDALDYVLLEDVKPDIMIANNWTELTQDQTIYTKPGKKILLNDVMVIEGVTKYFALAVHMKEEAGNEYKNAGIEFNAIVEATQATQESDAFGTDYDAAAKYSIETADELNFMLAYPENGATYVIANDITWEGGKINALQSASYTIDLNGHIVTLNGNTGYVLDKEGVNINLTVKDNSTEHAGQLKSGGARFIVCNEGDTIIGNGYLVGGSDRNNNIVSGNGTWTN